MRQIRLNPGLLNMNISLDLSVVCDCSIDFHALCLTLLLSLSLSGKNCELCTSGFFRLGESDPTSVDVCQPCNCHTAGTVNDSVECAQVHANTNETLLVTSGALVT